MTSIADEGVFFVVTQAFSMTGGVIGLFILNWRMTILVLLFIPIKYVVMKKFAKQRKKVMDDFINDSQKYARWSVSYTHLDVYKRQALLNLCGKIQTKCRAYKN